MAILRSDPIVRPATPSDYDRLTRLVNSDLRVHRHLDWKTPLDWLGRQPFLVAENHNLIESVLACPPDPPGVAWIRLFAAVGHLSAEDYFKRLIEPAAAILSTNQPVVIGAIALYDWFERILEHSGFHLRQHIVVLEWHQNSLFKSEPLQDIEIRQMLPDDLPAVSIVDNAAFEPLWHNSLEALTLAYNQAAWSTVAVQDGEIIGYQISTAIPLSGHLARLAVIPGLQRGGVGSALVIDVMKHFRREGAWRVTVNTQDTNTISLALYEKLGFRRTGEVFPVFVLE